MSDSSWGIVVASTSIPATRVFVGGGAASAAGATASAVGSATASDAARTRRRRTGLGITEPPRDRVGPTWTAARYGRPGGTVQWNSRCQYVWLNRTGSCLVRHSTAGTDPGENRPMTTDRPVVTRYRSADPLLVAR